MARSGPGALATFVCVPCAILQHSRAAELDLHEPNTSNIAGVRMSYRIFDVAPNGETRERRWHDVPVVVERRTHSVGARPLTDVEWGKLRDRLREADRPADPTPFRVITR
jgi:hypothetical protein